MNTKKSRQQEIEEIRRICSGLDQKEVDQFFRDDHPLTFTEELEITQFLARVHARAVDALPSEADED